MHGGYADGKWLSSFVGFAPARNPRLVISVTIDEPVIAHHGGTVAAPTFRRIMEASLRHLGVVPNAIAQPAKRAPKRAASERVADAKDAKDAPRAKRPQRAGRAAARVRSSDERRVPDLLGERAQRARRHARARPAAGAARQRLRDRAASAAPARSPSSTTRSKSRWRRRRKTRPRRRLPGLAARPKPIKGAPSADAGEGRAGRRGQDRGPRWLSSRSARWSNADSRAA